MNCLTALWDRGTRARKAITPVGYLVPYEDDVVLEVPSYSQTDCYSCGAIAAWCIVETFHPRANFAKVYRAVSPDLDGVGPARMVVALRRFNIGVGLRSRLGWREICENIDAGYPMIIGTGFEDPEVAGDHWSVLYGYRPYPRMVYLGNQIGVRRTQVRVDWHEFKTEWWNPKGQAMVCWGK